ncbi:MAG: hypothetical protein V3V08_03790 [Nannocystaceae bacterium]
MPSEQTISTDVMLAMPAEPAATCERGLAAYLAIARKRGSQPERLSPSDAIAAAGDMLRVA